jgi:hypothetical protein
MYSTYTVYMWCMNRMYQNRTRGYTYSTYVGSFCGHSTETRWALPLDYVVYDYIDLYQQVTTKTTPDFESCIGISLSVRLIWVQQLFSFFPNFTIFYFIITKTPFTLVSFTPRGGIHKGNKERPFCWLTALTDVRRPSYVACCQVLSGCLFCLLELPFRLLRVLDASKAKATKLVTGGSRASPSIVTPFGLHNDIAPHIINT